MWSVMMRQVQASWQIVRNEILTLRTRLSFWFVVGQSSAIFTLCQATSFCSSFTVEVWKLFVALFFSLSKSISLSLIFSLRRSGGRSIRRFVRVRKCINLQRRGIRLECSENLVATADGKGDGRRQNIGEKGEAMSPREEEATGVKNQASYDPNFLLARTEPASSSGQEWTELHVSLVIGSGFFNSCVSFRLTFYTQICMRKRFQRVKRGVR